MFPTLHGLKLSLSFLSQYLSLGPTSLFPKKNKLKRQKVNKRDGT